ncbi:MAG: phosphate ABC transporter permease PstA [Alphaproteobacteria bacterium]|nr:phosphate ABC transporter permease PstA [Alphaproteobacteria bacterium]
MTDFAVKDVSMKAAERTKPARNYSTDLAARGEPMVFAMGGSLAIGLIMIVGILGLIAWFGFTTFWPQPVSVVHTKDGKVIAGEVFRSESFKPTEAQLSALPDDERQRIAEQAGFAERTLYRVGNYDLYGEDFQWLNAYDVASVEQPHGLVYMERQEWGPFVGRVAAMTVDGTATDAPGIDAVQVAVSAGQDRRAAIIRLKQEDIAENSRAIEALRLDARSAVLAYGANDPRTAAIQADVAAQTKALEEKAAALNTRLAELQAEDAKYALTLADISGQTKQQPLSSIVRIYQPNDIGFFGAAGVYLDRWAEFIFGQPREANTEGGVWPAIVGTLAMTVLLSLLVAPFGVMTALYLREYARQGRLVSFVRICVNNLAGVPSIVYGVFGLGFFCYILGGSIDQLFFAEKLPTPTFGTGGVLWAALTLALLTVPVVIVATEEALAAVPRSMREGSLACGASKWQTIRWIVLPRALPGIMTGLILAMARGAGEVAPLMLVGVVKLAPELPLDLSWPFVHLDRSFMHLGFHIFDVGFQSRNAEAGRPMVFVTTLLLIAIILVMNAAAITIRSRLKRRFAGSQF